MLASGLAVLSALLAHVGAAEFEAAARIDTRVGEAPTGAQVTAAGQSVPAQQKQVAVAATPLLGLRWSDDVNDLRASSATRILWRPVPLLEMRPLFLETLEASYLLRPSRRSRWRLELRGSYGEEDYTSLAQQFTNQPALPTALTMLSLNAAGDGLWRQSRRTTMILLVGALHRRALDSSTVGTSATTAPALPTQTLVTATPGVRFALSRRSNLEALVGLAETDIQGIRLATPFAGTRANIFTVQPQVGLIEDLNRRHQLRAFVGLTYAAVLINPDKSRPWLPLTPLLRAELDSFLMRTRASVVRSTFGAGAAWFADPVLGAAVLRGTAEARLDATFGRRWSASARALFTTDLGRPLAPAVPGGISPDETIAQLEVPIHYRWTDHLALEFGARFAERAPNLSATDFRWRNRELWAFLNVLTTTRPPPRRS